MSEATTFKFGLMKEKTVNGFIDGVMAGTIDFDYSKSYSGDNNEAYNFIIELEKRITTYLQEEKNPENKKYYDIQDKIFSDYLKLKIFGVIKSK